MLCLEALYLASWSSRRVSVWNSGSVEAPACGRKAKC
jgi:hypothetical protein